MKRNETNSRNVWLWVRMGWWMMGLSNPITHTHVGIAWHSTATTKLFRGNWQDNLAISAYIRYESATVFFFCFAEWCTRVWLCRINQSWNNISERNQYICRVAVIASVNYSDVNKPRRRRFDGEMRETCCHNYIRLICVRFASNR